MAKVINMEAANEVNPYGRSKPAAPGECAGEQGAEWEEGVTSDCWRYSVPVGNIIKLGQGDDGIYNSENTLKARIMNFTWVDFTAVNFISVYLLKWHT